MSDVYLVQYLGNSVTAPTFLHISSRKVEKLVSDKRLIR